MNISIGDPEAFLAEARAEAGAGKTGEEGAKTDAEGTAPDEETQTPHDDLEDEERTESEDEEESGDEEQGKGDDQKGAEPSEEVVAAANKLLEPYAEQLTFLNRLADKDDNEALMFLLDQQAKLRGTDRAGLVAALGLAEKGPEDDKTKQNENGVNLDDVDFDALGDRDFIELAVKASRSAIADDLAEVKAMLTKLAGGVEETQKLTQEQRRAQEMKAMVEKSTADVNTKLSQKYDGFSVKPEQVAKAMAAYPAEKDPVKAVEMAMFGEIQKHVTATRTKGRPKAPEGVPTGASKGTGNADPDKDPEGFLAQARAEAQARQNARTGS